MIGIRHQPKDPASLLLAYSCGARRQTNRINLPKFLQFVINSFTAIGGFQKEKRVILKSPAGKAKA
jgi:hypothetical protein